MRKNSQFRYLTRHFFGRFFDKESITDGADPKANVIQTISMLAVPGLMLTFWMRISPYFFVSYSMIVMGFVMVFKWDSLFPDRRDYLNLASLPIHYRDLFIAKISALCLFLALFAVSSNFFATLMVPLGSRGSFLQALTAHVSAVFGGALFMALGFAGVQGLLMNVLPHYAFRRISPVVQMVSVSVLLTIFLIYPLIASSIQPLMRRDSPVLYYFPFFWFLGIYMTLFPGAPANPVFDRLAWNGLYGLITAGAIVVLSYAIAYRRHSQSILEAIDFHTTGDDGWRSRLSQRLDRTLLASQVQRASFRFIKNILMRSARHQVFLAVYIAIGLSLALSSLFAVNPAREFPFVIVDSGMLALPLILSFFVVSGLRATFNIPYELPGNWVFRVTEMQDAGEYIAATRRFIAVCGLLPLMTLIAALEFAYWSWRDAAFHLVFESIVSLVLLQILLFNFHKVPFTCSYYPGKKNMAILAGIYLYGFTTYSSSMVALEQWLQGSSIRALLFLIAGAAIIVALSSARRQGSARLIYEEQPDTKLQSLELS
jgi:hypothetical protein